MNLFKKPTPRQYAERELLEAKLHLLEALTAREYSDSIVRYRENQVNRLVKFLEVKDDK